MTEIRTTGVFVVGECNVQLPGCQALEPAPITVIKLQPSGRQVNVCSACLQEMLDRQEWHLAGARFSAKYDFVLLSGSNEPLIILEVKRSPEGTDIDSERWTKSYVRNLVAHGQFRRNAILILSLLDSKTYIWRLSGGTSEPTMISEVDTTQAFEGLGLEPPSKGLDERFAQSYYYDFIGRLITAGVERNLDWVMPLDLAGLPLTGATIKSEVAISA